MVPLNFNDALIESISIEIKESFRMKRMTLQGCYKEIFFWRNIFLFNVWPDWGRHLLFHLHLIVCIAQQLKELSRHIHCDRSQAHFIVDVSIRLIFGSRVNMFLSNITYHNMLDIYHAVMLSKVLYTFTTCSVCM